MAVSPLKTVPWGVSAWDRAPLGLRNRPSYRRAVSRWRWEGRKTLESPQKGRFRRCTGRLNATQPGVIGHQHPIHTWIGPLAQANPSRPGNSHSYSQNAHEDAVKKPLTLQFYWARKGASEARGIGGDPRKSTG